jgi:molecular chaperone DnaJ
MPVLRRPGRRGDLRVVADVVVPRKLSREQRELLQRLAETTAQGGAEGSGESLVGKLRRLLQG